MSYAQIKNWLQRFLFTRRITVRKVMNFCLIVFQHAVTKDSYVIGNPIELVIDPCNICNLHCPLCPTGQGRDERLKGKMSFENFKKIIDELGAYLYEVDLHNWGEPLLNKEIYDMILYSHVHNIKVSLSTNLNFFDEVRCERLVKCNLDHLIVSLDGASQETYEKYRVGGNFDKVIDGIKMVIQKKKELYSFSPFITWQFLVMKHNEHEIPDAQRIATEIGVDKFELMPIHGDMGREVFWNEDKITAKAVDWLPRSKNYGLNKMSPCNFLWCQAVVNWNGAVSPCCAVYPEKYDFGNMFDAGGFKKIWNNEKYRAARKIIRQKKTHSSLDKEIICSYCLINSSCP